MLSTNYGSYSTSGWPNVPNVVGYGSTGGSVNLNRSYATSNSSDLKWDYSGDPIAKTKKNVKKLWRVPIKKVIFDRDRTIVIFHEKGANGKDKKEIIFREFEDPSFSYINRIMLCILKSYSDSKWWSFFSDYICLGCKSSDNEDKFIKGLFEIHNNRKVDLALYKDCIKQIKHIFFCLPKKERDKIVVCKNTTMEPRRKDDLSI